MKKKNYKPYKGTPKYYCKKTNKTTRQNNVYTNWLKREKIIWFLYDEKMAQEIN